MTDLPVSCGRKDIMLASRTGVSHVTRPRLCGLLAAGAILGGCGGAQSHHRASGKDKNQPAGPAAAAPASHRRSKISQSPEALVTAETENRLAIVNLRTGHVTRRITVAAGPQYVAAERGLAVVTSTAAGVVTLLAGEPLHVRAVLHGFSTPRITELSPDGHHVYVTDDARGTLTVIGLGDARVAGRVFVGAGAHHMTSSPDQTRLWIALGESAHTISIVDTADINRPAVVGRFDPGFPAHDLSFSPDGRRVWITSATGSSVAVFGAFDHRLLFRVPVGPPPQHVAFDGAFAYLTSGYGRTIERVAAATGRVIERASSPYGSFEPSAADGFVTTASLLNGQLAIFTPALKLLSVVRVAPATRDVTIADR